MKCLLYYNYYLNYTVFANYDLVLCCLFKKTIVPIPLRHLKSKIWSERAILVPKVVN